MLHHTHVQDHGLVLRHARGGGRASGGECEAFLGRAAPAWVKRGRAHMRAARGLVPPGSRGRISYLNYYSVCWKTGLAHFIVLSGPS